MGAPSVLQLFQEEGFPLGTVILASGMAQGNPLLVQILVDVLGRPAPQVPRMAQATAVGAAIHGAVAAGVVDGYREAAARFGARIVRTVEPRPAHTAIYDDLYKQYSALSKSHLIRRAMHEPNRISPAAKSLEPMPEQEGES